MKSKRWLFVRVTLVLALAPFAVALAPLQYAKSAAVREATDALRDNTGGSWLYATPGLRVAAGPTLSLYGYAQIPLRQRIDRIQLVAPYHLMVGTTLALGR